MTKDTKRKKLSVVMIVVGDEILNGRTKDLNASFLTQYLFKIGLHLHKIEFVRDDEEDFFETLTRSLTSADIVITSGGIGPTLDDLTKKCLSDYFKKPLEIRADVEKIIHQNYGRFGRTWEPTLNYYHHFPQDFIAFNNPKGLAPGLGFFDQKNEALVLSAPGVPREFEAMVEDEFFPFIEKKFKERFQKTFQTVVRTHSVPEEKIFGEIAPKLWQDLEKYGKVSSLPHTIGIDIIVTYQCDLATHSKNQLEIKTIFEQTPMGKFVWQYGNLPLNQLLMNTLIEKKLTIGFAESCTGGLCSSKMTDLSGSSQVFMGSIVSYSNEIKMNLLGVKSSTLEKHGAVSVECAEEMAKGARDKLQVDIAVSITGIAGPLGGSVEKPVGTVCYAIATKQKIKSEKMNMPGDRIRKKDRFSEYALWLIYREITSETFFITD